MLERLSVMRKILSDSPKLQCPSQEECHAQVYREAKSPLDQFLSERISPPTQNVKEPQFQTHYDIR